MKKRFLKFLLKFRFFRWILKHIGSAETLEKILDIERDEKEELEKERLMFTCILKGIITNEKLKKRHIEFNSSVQHIGQIIEEESPEQSERLKNIFEEYSKQ